MKLESQVCSLELAKRLKELGVKQENLFYWANYWDEEKKKRVWNLFYGRDEADGVNEHTSAFTVAELGEILIKTGYDSMPWYSAYDKKWVRGSKPDKMYDSDTEADSRAKMLIYLIEKGIVNPKEGKDE